MKTIALLTLGTFLALSGSSSADRRHRRGHSKKVKVVVVQEPARSVVVVAPQPTVVVRPPSVTITR